jgi:hypothetical protein
MLEQHLRLRYTGRSLTPPRKDSLPVSRLAAWLSGGLGKTGAPRPLRPLTLAATEQGGGGKEAEK